jgi:ABC-type branched-subunit amino acid transport system ATPase component
MTGTAAVGGRLAELEVRALTVRFGGVVAVEHVGLIARSGVITGVIGPNGAGKTTIFNACSGFVRPTEGGVFYRGENITRRSRSWRARSGLGRTFQQLALFESMTVEENVRLGCEGRQAGSNPLTLLFGRRRAQLEIEARADEAIHLCKLADVRLARVSDLSSGRRRLVEFARCLAGNFDVLLLDEPSAGLDTAESLEFAQILRRVATERGTGVLLVEHYMDLVMGVCSYIYVLDFGCLIFEGTPAEVQASPVVQAAYLGMAAAGV